MTGSPVIPVPNIEDLVGMDGLPTGATAVTADDAGPSDLNTAAVVNAALQLQQQWQTAHPPQDPQMVGAIKSIMESLQSLKKAAASATPSASLRLGVNFPAPTKEAIAGALDKNAKVAALPIMATDPDPLLVARLVAPAIEETVNIGVCLQKLADPAHLASTPLRDLVPSPTTNSQIFPGTVEELREGLVLMLPLFGNLCQQLNVLQMQLWVGKLHGSMSQARASAEGQLSDADRELVKTLGLTVPKARAPAATPHDDVRAKRPRQMYAGPPMAQPGWAPQHATYLPRPPPGQQAPPPWQAAPFGQGRQGRMGPQGPSVCYVCQAPGHYAKDCPMKR
jgi:hypothetical protein